MRRLLSFAAAPWPAAAALVAIGVGLVSALAGPIAVLAVTLLALVHWIIGYQRLRRVILNWLAGTAHPKAEPGDRGVAPGDGP